MRITLYSIHSTKAYIYQSRKPCKLKLSKEINQLDVLIHFYHCEKSKKKEQENIVPTQVFYLEKIVRIFVFFSTPVSSYLPYCLQLYF